MRKTTIEYWPLLVRKKIKAKNLNDFITKANKSRVDGEARSITYGTLVVASIFCAN